MGGRDAVRVSRCSIPSIRRISPSSSGTGRSGKFPLLLDDGEPVVETTLHHRASAGAPSRAQPLDSRRRARPAGPLPRPLLRPLCHEQHAEGGVRHRSGPRAIARPLWRRTGHEASCAPPTTGWRRIWATGRGRSASSSRWPIAPRRRRCSTPTGSRRSARSARGSRPIARGCWPIRSSRARSTKAGPTANSSRWARPTATDQAKARAAFNVC